MVREQFAGRDEALAALRAAARPGRRGGRLVVLRGPAGMGKTRLLAEFADGRAEGVLRISAAGAADPRGLDVVLDLLRAELDRTGRSGLVDVVSGLARLRARDDVPSSAVVAELTRTFAALGSTRETAVLVDDVRELTDPAPLLLAARRTGCLVVAAVREEAAEPVAMADEVLDLHPLTDEQVRAALGDELGADEHRELRAALGPLYGNPGTAKETARMLRSTGRAELPPDHDLLRRARALGPAAVKLLAAAAAGALEVDELAELARALGEDRAECGRLLDRLVELGALVADDEGDRLGCRCPALAAAAETAEPEAARRVRAATVVRPVPLAPARARRNAAPAPEPEWSEVDVRMVEMIGRGCTNRRIATAFGISEKTVEAHLTRLFAKTGCRSRVELVAAGRYRSAALRPAA